MAEEIRQNCWEFGACGREPGGRLVGERGVCPAAVVVQSSPVNGTTSSGRCCWLVAGTFCHGEVQGAFEQKIMSCLQCAFLKHVRDQEGVGFSFRGGASM